MGSKLTDKELERRYKILHELRAEANRDFEALIKKVKKEKYDFSYKITALINLTKDQFRSKIDAKLKRDATAKDFKKYYKKVQGGWRCKKCNLKFNTQTGMHIHIGTKHQ